MSNKFDLLLDLQKSFEEGEKLARIHISNFDSLPRITKIIVINDFSALPKIEKMISEGKLDYEKAGNFIGSYARVDWLLEQYEKGLLSTYWLVDNFPLIWVGSDPIGDDQKYLRYWRKAFELNRYKTLVDNKDKRLPRKDLITVYQGRAVNNNTSMGISFSLDYDVAYKFSMGAAYRTNIIGEVIKKEVRRNHIMAYLTTRNEEEIIIDPTVFRE